MRELPLLHGIGREPVIVALGAHCDDIEIGCGGTILRLAGECPAATLHWVVFSADDEREGEARASASAFADGVADTHVTVHRFRESYFPFVGDELKDSFEDLKRRVDPDLVLTHCLEDRHQDHRLVAELTHNTFRDHTILEYEIPKFDGDLRPTTVFVPLARDHMSRKNDLLMEHFGSQRSRSWFDPETFAGLARIRGVECNAPDGYAEGFRCRKTVVGFAASGGDGHSRNEHSGEEP